MSDRSWVLAIDPGKMTGWAFLGLDAEKPVAYQDPPYEFECKMDKFFQGALAPGGLVVMERFTVTTATAKKSPQPDALKIIGTIEYLAKRHANLDLNYQSPSDVMRLVPDSRLKTLGWYVPGRVHANDALRHMATALAKRNLLKLPT